MKRKLNHFLATLVVALIAMSIVPSVALAQTATPSDVEFFEKEIRPLLVEHCYSATVALRKTASELASR